MAASLGYAADAKKFNLKVVDEQGQPVAKFEALIYSGTGLRWAGGTNGAVSLSTEQLPPVVRVIVRADGYASTTQQFTGNSREKLLQGEESITLARGEEVKLQFKLPEGMTWPKDAMPEVYFDAWKEVVQSARSADGRQWYESRNGNKPIDFNMFNVHADGAGNFALRLAANTPAFYVGINIPGFLQYFNDGPYSQPSFKNGLLKIDRSAAGCTGSAIQIRFHSAGQTAVQNHPVSGALSGFKRAELFGNGRRKRDARRKPFRLTEIPSGNYLVLVYTLSAGEVVPFFSEEADPHRFRDRKQVSLRPGQTEKIDFQYVPLDANAFHGKRTAVVRFETADGKPAEGRDVAVSYYVDHYGVLPVFKGKVPESGEITLNDISDAKPADGSARKLYAVRIGDDARRRVRLQQQRHHGTFHFPLPAASRRHGAGCGATECGRRQNDQAQRSARQDCGARLLGHLVRALPAGAGEA